MNGVFGWEPTWPTMHTIDAVRCWADKRMLPNGCNVHVPRNSRLGLCPEHHEEIAP